MTDPQRMPVVDPISVMAGGRELRVVPPGWFAWQDALESAARPGGDVDPQKLLEEALAASVRDGEGRRVERAVLQSFSSEDGDRLVSAMLDLIEQQRRSLALQLDEEKPGRYRLEGRGVSLKLRAWTFGERNDALRRALRVVGGQVALNLSGYERMMILTCVRTARGGALDPAAVSAWPVPLGQGVLQGLDLLNGVEKNHAEVLAACIATGHDHPDLTMIRLCQAFGWQPEQVQSMDARTAERLALGLRELEKAGLVPQGAAAAPAVSYAAPAAVGPAPGYVAPGQEGVTRIIVTDD